MKKIAKTPPPPPPPPPPKKPKSKFNKRPGRKSTREGMPRGILVSLSFLSKQNRQEDVKKDGDSIINDE